MEDECNGTNTYNNSFVEQATEDTGTVEER
jgi:hypothetical protein